MILSKTEQTPIYMGRGIFQPAISTKEYLLKLIKKEQPITRSELVKETGIPRTTIYDSLVKLMLDKEIYKYSVPSKTRGRPRVFYKVQN